MRVRGKFPTASIFGWIMYESMHPEVDVQDVTLLTGIERWHSRVQPVIVRLDLSQSHGRLLGSSGRSICICSRALRRHRT